MPLVNKIGNLDSQHFAQDFHQAFLLLHISTYESSVLFSIQGLQRHAFTTCGAKLTCLNRPYIIFV